ncbi:MAG: MlaD family protein [Fimbriimonadales bacterium]|nr:MlaD family protein [Fimbriimonadales bacterium]
MQNATKVGLLVVLFGALLLGGFAVLGRSVFRKHTDLYYAELPDAAGLAEGARVLMAGVPVGKVVRVELAGPTRARLTLEIERGVRIPKGSSVELPQSLLGFGDNPLLLVPGPVDAPPAPPGEVFAGRVVSPLQTLLPDSQQTLQELNATLRATRSLLEDQRLLQSLRDLLETSNRTVEKFGGLASRVDGLVRDNRAVVAQALADAARAIADVRRGIRAATDLLTDPRYRRQAESVLASLVETGEKTESLVDSLNQLVNDTELRSSVRRAASNLQTMTESGTRIAANTEKIAENGVTVSEKAVTLADKAIQLADEARGVLTKLQNFFDRVPSGGSLRNLETRMDVVAEIDPGRWRTDFEATLPVRDFRIHAGLFDAFEANKITAQIGRSMGPAGEYRYGVYAGKPGFGVDYAIAPNVGIRADLFGLNDPRVDLRARIRLGNDWIGWFGVNRAFDGNVPMVGIGIRR